MIKDVVNYQQQHCIFGYVHIQHYNITTLNILLKLEYIIIDMYRKSNNTWENILYIDR